MNSETIITKRLILRRFKEEDIEALYNILKREKENRFLPWFPLSSIAEAKDFYYENYEKLYASGTSCAYAICLKEDNYPIGYISVKNDEPYDLGYGLIDKYWHQGITTEAAKALVEALKKDGLSYISATHDINNPRSGGVMINIGMKYQYTYEELVLPKKELITFRLYVLSLDGDKHFISKYWDNSKVHYIEDVIGE